MRSWLQSTISDFLHSRSLDDRDNFAGRASDAIAKYDRPSEAQIKVALNTTKTNLHRHHRDILKSDLIDMLASHIYKLILSQYAPNTTNLDICDVLFLAAAPQSQNPLALGEERRLIEQKLRGTSKSDRIRFTDKHAVRPDDLLQCVNECKPNILHFSGHGDIDGILLSSNSGKSDVLLDTDLLDELVSHFDPIPQVILLNSCYSESQAQTLIKSIPCVIGMNSAVNDDAAAMFASAFYRAIGSGKSIQSAFDQGKLSIKLEQLDSQDVPVLLENKKGLAASLVLLR